MSKLKLPDVTLVMVETREHALARMAIEECLDKVEFGDVVIITDRPLEFSSLTKSHGCYPRFKTVPDWPNKLGWSRSWWFDVPEMLRTSQTLNIQWDSWVWMPELWTDDFLQYDYIGAPWWYKDGKNVGNGGFSMVSTRLKRFIKDRAATYPCDTPVDDDLLCRKYRMQLENYGFVWAPEKVASQFAFECCRPSPVSQHFGFHALFNWPEVLPRDRLMERVKVVMQSSYITRQGGLIWRAFSQRHPDVVREVLQDVAKNLKGAIHG